MKLTDLALTGLILSVRTEKPHRCENGEVVWR